MNEIDTQLQEDLYRIQEKKKKVKKFPSLKTNS